jgi:hypothetical protein
LSTSPSACIFTGIPVYLSFCVYLHRYSCLPVLVPVHSHCSFYLSFYLFLGSVPVYLSFCLFIRSVPVFLSFCMFPHRIPVVLLPVLNLLLLLDFGSIYLYFCTPHSLIFLPSRVCQHVPYTLCNFTCIPVYLAFCK